MSVYLRWGSSSIDIVGADTRKLRGPKRRVLIVHETIRSRLSVDRSLVRMIGRALPSGLYWCAYIHRLDTVHAVKCNQRNLELDVSRTFAVTSTSSRWVNVGTESRAALDRRTRHITCRTSSIETSRKLQSSRPSWRTYDGGGGSTHSFNFLDEELGKFVGVDVSRG